MDILRQVSGFVFGSSPLAQIIQVFLLGFFAVVILIAVRSFITVMTQYGNATAMLLPDLYDGPNIVYQDPEMDGANTIYPSVNAPAGLEFSYSCFLMIDKATFQPGTTGLRHVFHKGSASYKPLICPGVYVRSNTNSLVVYMNEAMKWDSFCEIPNIPVGKFFHLAVVVRNRNVDVYINGNVAHRMQLSSVPRQNFGDVYVFKNEPFRDMSSADSAFRVLGAANGLISRLLYTGYAMNYEQIDQQMRAGPSSKLVSTTRTLPPYLADNWWVTYTA